MPLYTDQTGHILQLNAPPQRIISLVPSQTELLYDMGLATRIAGITKFCVHPEEAFLSKTRVGGTKTVKMDVIRQLQPDLIIANKEENVKEQIEELRSQYPVWTSDIGNLDEACAMMTGIGEITNANEAAAGIVATIRKGFEQLQPVTPLRVAYLIWQKPFMTIGGDTFIGDMLQRCGFVNVFGDRSRYPETSVEEIQAARCDLLLLSSEPFPFREKHVQEWQQQLPGAKVLLADGEMFSWYGSRLRLSSQYFSQLQTSILNNPLHHV
ncbi:MAG: ABC transporter substrate-binding protein [Bacteroidetes bacterium]|nr:ABC transporter substrate-binding protein [Bacteroidota bacterium]